MTDFHMTLHRARLIADDAPRSGPFTDSSAGIALLKRALRRLTANRDERPEADASRVALLRAEINRRVGMR